MCQNASSAGTWKSNDTGHFAYLFLPTAGAGFLTVPPVEVGNRVSKGQRDRGDKTMRRGVKLACSCEEAIQRITTALAGVGFRVLRGFDLREALAAQAEECPCPYHGTARCTCSYTVLLVYGPETARQPAASPGLSRALRAECVPSGTQSARSGQARRRGSGHAPAPYLLVQLIAVHSHHDETWLTLLPTRGDFYTVEPSDAALDARLLRGLVTAVTEAPGRERVSERGLTPPVHPRECEP